MTVDVERLVDGIHDYLARAFAPLVQRVKALEDRAAPAAGEVADLRQRIEALERRLPEEH